MYKQLLSATAIVLALSLQGCGSLSAPHEDNAFTAARPPAKSAFDEKIGLADAALAAGDSASAIRMYRGLAREYPISLEPRLKLGSALLAANAPQEAARAYEGANMISATYDGLTGIGRVYLALRQPADALHAFDRAAQMRPGDTAARNGQGVALDQLGRHVEAQKIYLAILEKDPSNIKVRSNYALSLAFAGKYDEATDILNSLAQVPDSDDRIRQNLALVYGLAGNPGQAAHFGRMDLDEDAVSSNLKYYGAMRNVDVPAEKAAVMTRPTAQPTPNQIGPFDAAQSKPASQHVASASQSAPVPQAAPTGGIKEDRRAVTSNLDARKSHAEKPVLGLAGMKPVVVARVEPAKSSSPAEAKAPTDEELAEILAPQKPEKVEAKVAKPVPKSVVKKHASLADLPMTRAEAAAEAATPGNSDDLVPLAQEPRAKTATTSAQAGAKSADQAAAVTVASSIEPEQDLKASVPVKPQAARSRQPAVPAVPAGITASIKAKAAVPAVSAVKPTAEAKSRRAVSVSAVTTDSNPIDAGARAPAVL